MSGELRDLWPDFVDVTSLHSPRTILTFQAKRLEHRTKGVITARITSENVPDKDEIYHHFDLVVPALKNYRYRLFSVGHESESVYPVWVVSHDDETDANDQAEFESALEAVLKDSRTRSIISSLKVRVNEQLQTEEAGA